MSQNLSFPRHFETISLNVAFYLSLLHEKCIDIQKLLGY
jgi:hypothetical protein